MDRIPFLAVVPEMKESDWGLPAVVYAALAIGAGCVGIAALVFRRSMVRETTLLPAWWWALAAVVAASGVELAAGLAADGSATWIAPLRLAAVTLSFCPILAVLGAKRPQHVAWSFVVAAFWGIVTLPAAETFFLQRGQRLEIGDARSFFLWILIAVGPINYLPTRQWLAATLLAAGQILALADYLPLVHRTLFADQCLAGLWLGSLSLVVAREPRSRAAGKYDRLWLDFRDTFGLFWSLRLQERVNSVAQTSGWPLWLSWSGLRELETDRAIAALDSSVEPILRTTLKGLLRRFVSGRWIAKRLGQDLD
ncbi:MAG: hypothetical protein L0211_23780 [Planctomycetaceae bacterium]|nr:hypothetical protein [Planctomycetaceae bacterium]